jgi:DNA-directed RNA polymerase specialized sigma24 family protein
LTNCLACPSYHKGKGSSECIKCDKVGNKAIFEDKEFPRRGALLHALRLDKEYLENLQNPESPQLKDIFRHLSKINTRNATILLQTTVLGLTQAESGAYHGISDGHVRRLLKDALRELRELL